MKPVRTRIAPSPTGDPHVGTAYMALYNFIFARHFKGKFILRVEDTDRRRCRPAYEESIYEALKWCGITWDEGPDIGGKFGPYRQSERTELYREHAQILLDQGKAYKCFCTQEDLQEARELMAKQGSRIGYDRRCRNLSEEEIEAKQKAGLPYTIRLKVPLSGDCIFEDCVRGRTAFPWADVDDQILLKSDGFPTYFLANVVDDHFMQISHVIRGEEWLTSTPKHILLYESFGWECPVFYHMPLLLGKDGKKLSKRKNPTSIFYYRDSGYLPEAFINFLTLMGYSMQGDREIYPLQDIVKEFDPKRIGQSGAIFDVEKLEWLNQQYMIQNIPLENLWNRIQEWGFNEPFMQRLMPLVHTRMKTFGDFISLTDFFFINHLPLREDLFVSKGVSGPNVALILQGMIWYMEENENWASSGVQDASRFVAEFFGVNHKKVVMPLLFAAIQGKHHGLPLFDSAALLGKDRTRARFLNAIEFLGGISKKRMDDLTKAWEKKEGQGLFQGV